MEETARPTIMVALQIVLQHLKPSNPLTAQPKTPHTNRLHSRQTEELKVAQPITTQQRLS
jgi:hypothetical protein